MRELLTREKTAPEKSMKDLVKLIRILDICVGKVNGNVGFLINNPHWILRRKWLIIYTVKLKIERDLSNSIENTYFNFRNNIQLLDHPVVCRKAECIMRRPSHTERLRGRQHEHVAASCPR